MTEKATLAAWQINVDFEIIQLFNQPSSLFDQLFNFWCIWNVLNFTLFFAHKMNVKIEKNSKLKIKLKNSRKKLKTQEKNSKLKEKTQIFGIFICWS